MSIAVTLKRNMKKIISTATECIMFLQLVAERLKPQEP